MSCGSWNRSTNKAKWLSCSATCRSDEQTRRNNSEHAQGLFSHPAVTWVLIHHASSVFTLWHTDLFESLIWMSWVSVATVLKFTEKKFHFGKLLVSEGPFNVHETCCSLYSFYFHIQGLLREHRKKNMPSCSQLPCTFFFLILHTAQQTFTDFLLQVFLLLFAPHPKEIMIYSQVLQSYITGNLGNCSFVWNGSSTGPSKCQTVQPSTTSMFYVSWHKIW